MGVYCDKSGALGDSVKLWPKKGMRITCLSRLEALHHAAIAETYRRA